MQKFSNIFLAFLILTGTTEFHQFLKIPLLLTHFRDHRTHDPGMSLSAFLSSHYSASIHPDDRDEQDDRGLPFRSIENVTHMDVFVGFPKPAIQEPPVFPSQNSPCYHPEGQTSSLSYTVFRPPRSC